MSSGPGRAAVFASVVGAAIACGTVSGDSSFEFGSPLCMASAQVQETEATGILRGVGVVKAIDAATGWLTLDHEDIKGFMPAMEMMYNVKSPEISAGLHVGDRVAFDIDAEHYIIVGVAVVKRAM